MHQSLITIVSDTQLTAHISMNWSIQSHKKVSEYDLEIPQSQTAGQPAAPWGKSELNRTW